MATITTEKKPDTVADQAGVADAVRTAHDARSPIHPVGGGTALNYGTAPSADSRALDLTALAKIVDYTPRDMTILLEAGVRMADLAATLAAERQQLPIDVPRAAEATIGGVVATNWSGPRRYGYGTIRDYVIGIHAVDGRGIPFKGGGRVVKNVAGYDFCKLLTGSLGTLGVITQLALKVKPQSERAATVVAACPNLDACEKILSRLVHLAAPPVAIDLLIGSAWNRDALPSIDSAGTATLAVRVEGIESEVAWLGEHVQYELWQGGSTDVHRLPETDADRLWAHQIEFSDRGTSAASDESPLVLKISVPPSSVMATVAALLIHDPACTIQAHAASGIIFARFTKFDAADVGPVLVGKLRPAAVQRGGSVVVVFTRLDGLTPHIVWGGRTEGTVLMERIKRKFDPNNILNPNRFVF